MAIDVAFEVLTDPDFLIEITVERANATPGSYVDGIFQEGGAPELLTVEASVQPIDAVTYSNLEEGERFAGLQVIYSLFEFRGSEDLRKADKIIGYLGDDWKVVQVEPWGHHGYFKSVIQKVSS